jgi:proteasome lid subunit RPN8/RPN11
MEEIRVPAAVLDAIAGHAHRELPNECCGLLVGERGLIAEAVRSANLLASPSRYRIDPAVHFDIMRRLRGSPRAIIGAYHSHPRSSPVPSPTDIAEAFYPDFVWVIVSLADAAPAFRAWRITSSGVAEIRLLEF